MATWKYILRIADLWSSSEGKGGTLPIAEVSKRIAARIKMKFAVMLNDDPSNDHYDSELVELVDALEHITGYDDVSPTEEFDNVWAGFYDWANANRVWVQTWHDKGK